MCCRLELICVILSNSGEGAFGVCYGVHYSFEIKADFAMKIVFAAGQKEEEAFKRELKMLAELSASPHIVNVIVGRS